MYNMLKEQSEPIADATLACKIMRSCDQKLNCLSYAHGLIGHLETVHLIKPLGLDCGA